MLSNHIYICILSIKVGFSRPTHSDSFSPKRCLCSEQVHCLDETVNLLNEMMTAVPCAAIVQLSGYGFQQLSPVKLKHPLSGGLWVWETKKGLEDQAIMGP